MYCKAGGKIHKSELHGLAWIEATMDQPGVTGPDTPCQAGGVSGLAPDRQVDLAYMTQAGIGKAVNISAVVLNQPVVCA